MHVPLHVLVVLLSVLSVRGILQSFRVFVFSPTLVTFYYYYFYLRTLVEKGDK